MIKAPFESTHSVALLAAEGFLPSVDPFVAHQLGGFGEILATVGTLVAEPGPVDGPVHLLAQLQAGLEPLVAQLVLFVLLKHWLWLFWKTCVNVCNSWSILAVIWVRNFLFRLRISPLKLFYFLD
jgi:hypothetical protein